MSTAKSLPPKKSRWRFRFGVGILLAILSVWLVYGINVLLTGREVDAVVAELDEREPGWRIEDIEKNRKEIKDDNNSALVVEAAYARLPTRFATRLVMIDEIHPCAWLTPAQTDELEKELQRATAALTLAQPLIEMDEGRFAFVIAPDYFSSLYPHLDGVRGIGALFHFDAIRHAQRGDLAKALRACRGVVNAGRSLGDEPFLISALTRMSLRHRAVLTLQRILGQGEAKDEDLALVQRLLEKEAEDDILKIALRGERGAMHRFFDEVENGRIRMSTLGNPKAKANFSNRITDLFSGNMVRQSHAHYLKVATEGLDVLKLPTEEQQAAADDWGKRMDAGDGPAMSKLLMPGVKRMIGSYQQSRARLLCAAAGVAVERHRLAKGAFPETLEEVAFLAKPLIDPFDGKPMRLRKTKDGVVVYSVGPRRDLKGDYWDQTPRVEDHAAFEFRMWEVKSRGGTSGLE